MFLGCERWEGRVTGTVTPTLKPQSKTSKHRQTRRSESWQSRSEFKVLWQEMEKMEEKTFLFTQS